MDPVTLTAGAAALGAGLDFAGGLFGSKSSKSESHNNRVEARRQFNEQMDFQKNYTQYRINDAIKAGVNPLAALGMNGGNVSPTISAGYGSDSGSHMSNAFSRVGDRIQRAVEAFNREANQEGVELDLENKRLQNRLLEARIDALTQPGHVLPNDNDPITTVVDTNPLMRYYNPRDRVRPVRRLGQKWMASDGRIVDLWNPDAIADAEIDNYEASRLMLQDYPNRGWWSDFKRWYRGDKDVPASHKNYWRNRWNKASR